MSPRPRQAATLRGPLLLAALLVATAAAPAPAGYLVVPNANTALGGNSQNSFPFEFAAAEATSMRYQQVYAASEFGGRPREISAIAFRAPSFISGATGTTGPLEIRLSTTTRAPDALTTVFASNSGPDETVVFSDSFTFPGSPPGTSPSPFAGEIPFVVPFLYDPSLGNLLLEVIHQPGGTVDGAFDAVFMAGDPVSRMFATDASASTGSTSAGGTVGLVTRFTVPEPQAPGAAALAMLALAARRGARRRRDARD